MSPTIVAIVAISVSLSFFAILFYAALKFFRWYSRRAEDGIREIYRQFHPSDAPSAGSVHVVYHTYSGLVAWFTQTEHSAYLPPAQARDFVRRLRNYNLKWGLLSYGCLFIPAFTFGNYWSQLRAITRQEGQERL